MITFLFYAYAQIYTIEYETKHFGSSMLKLDDSSLSDCRSRCDSMSACVGFVLEHGHNCSIRSEMGKAHDDSDTVSYSKVIPNTPPPIVVPSYVPPDIPTPTYMPTIASAKQTTLISTPASKIISQKIDETLSTPTAISQPTVNSSIPAPETKKNLTYSATNSSASNGDTPSLLNETLLILLSIVLFIFATALICYTINGQKEKNAEKTEVSEVPVVESLKSEQLELWIQTRNSNIEKTSLCSIDVNDEFDSLAFYEEVHNTSFISDSLQSVDSAAQHSVFGIF